MNDCLQIFISLLLIPAGLILGRFVFDLDHFIRSKINNKHFDNMMKKREIANEIYLQSEEHKNYMIELDKKIAAGESFCIGIGHTASYQKENKND